MSKTKVIAVVNQECEGKKTKNINLDILQKIVYL